MFGRFVNFSVPLRALPASGKLQMSQWMWCQLGPVAVATLLFGSTVLGCRLLDRNEDWVETLPKN